MEAKELRIGNYVMLHDSLLEIEAKHFDEYNIADVSVIECCSPITLTEKWLKRLGLKLNRHAEHDEESTLHPSIMLRTPDKHLELYNQGDYWYPQIYSQPELSSEKISVIGLERIKYVHQLQNLYFALTGEEFEIKELSE